LNQLFFTFPSISRLLTEIPRRFTNLEMFELFF